MTVSALTSESGTPVRREVSKSLEIALMTVSALTSESGTPVRREVSSLNYQQQPVMGKRRLLAHLLGPSC
jgi:hypothetical protein